MKDIYNKQKLNEVATSVEGGVNVTGGMHTFVGRGGQELDGLFAGPYHPDFGDLKTELQAQLDDKYQKMDYIQINTPYIKNEFETVDLDMYTFDDPSGLPGSKEKYINDSEKNWKTIDLDMYKFDDPSELPGDKSNFINDSEKLMKTVDIEMYKFDDPSELLGDKSNYVNDSDTNWKYVNGDIK